METLNQKKTTIISAKDFQRFYIDYHMGQQYHNQRFGQAFVNKHLLNDKELLNEKDDKRANQLILAKYVGR